MTAKHLYCVQHVRSRPVGFGIVGKSARTTARSDRQRRKHSEAMRLTLGWLVAGALLPGAATAELVVESVALCVAARANAFPSATSSLRSRPPSRASSLRRRVGSSPLPRLDPEAISFPAAKAADAMVLCSANGTIMRSTDGGSSWSPPASHEDRGFAPENSIGADTQRAIAGTGIPAGYTKGEGSAGPLWSFPKTSTSVETVSVDRAGKTLYADRSCWPLAPLMSRHAT